MPPLHPSQAPVAADVSASWKRCAIATSICPAIPSRRTTWRRYCCTNAKSILVKWNGKTTAWPIASTASTCNWSRAFSADGVPITSCPIWTCSRANRRAPSRMRPSKCGACCGLCWPTAAVWRSCRNQSKIRVYVLQGFFIETETNRCIRKRLDEEIDVSAALRPHWIYLVLHNKQYKNI